MYGERVDEETSGSFVAVNRIVIQTVDNLILDRFVSSGE